MTFSKLVVPVTLAVAACTLAVVSAHARPPHPPGASGAHAARDCTATPGKGRGGPSAREQIVLREITNQAGLGEPLLGMYGHATATGDVNGDGWLDLFVGTFTSKDPETYLRRGATAPGPDRLLLGGPDGFTLDETFPAMYERSSGAVFADLDDDGDLDLVLSRNWHKKTPYAPTVVLRNDGGRFTVATMLADDLRARTVAVLDYDGDGLLDLFVVDDHYGDNGRSTLFHNEGGLAFADATAAAGLPTGMTGLGAAVTDLTGDGWPDLLLSGSTRPPDSPDGEECTPVARMFVNRGDGAFSEVDASVFRLRTATATDEIGGVAVGDLNRDGRQDLVLGQHIHSDSLLQAGVPSASVYLNRGLDDAGAPVFEDVTEAAGLPEAHTRVPHVEIVDFDNDGWPDIHTSLSRGDGTDVAFFRNEGGRRGAVPRFTVPSGLGDERTTVPDHSGWEDIGIPRYWATGAAADYDRDGRMDSFLVEWFPELPSRLFHNETERVGHWLSIDVVPQAAAIGARVEVYCRGRLGRPDALIGSREVTAFTGYAAGIETAVWFGLGRARSVDVRVTLPRDQGVIELRGVRADRRVELSADDADAGGGR